MKTVILAAGQGTRLGQLGKFIPKGLIQYSDKSDDTLIYRLINQFLPLSTEVIVVGGYKSNDLFNSIRHRFMNSNIRLIDNYHYIDRTNYYSLAILKTILLWYGEPVLILDSDSYLSNEFVDEVHSQIINNSAESCLFTSPNKRPDGEWLILSDNSGKIINIFTDIIPEVNPGEVLGVTTGVSYFSSDGLKILLDNLSLSNKTYKYWDDIYLYNFSRMNLRMKSISRYCQEVDNLEDLVNLMKVLEVRYE